VSETDQKVAVVTGGSQGIGAGLVDGYRQRGRAVVANSLGIKPSKGPDILTVQGDVSEQATADQIISQALDRFGRVDTLVNNAGVFVSKPSSVADRADSVEPTALTALTKGGLAAVTRSLAVEHASRGIRVNAVAPGITQTPLHPAESYTPEALAGKLPPLGRAGQVSDVVDGILYLESAPYVTGEILHIDGGRTAGH
jgi:NAD(P)-dependent dehydrogenase (short-subunit alcohol dehydrogenase family)